MNVARYVNGMLIGMIGEYLYRVGFNVWALIAMIALIIGMLVDLISRWYIRRKLRNVNKGLDIVRTLFGTKGSGKAEAIKSLVNNPSIPAGDLGSAFIKMMENMTASMVDGPEEKKGGYSPFDVETPKEDLPKK